MSAIKILIAIIFALIFTACSEKDLIITDIVLRSLLIFELYR